MLVIPAMDLYEGQVVRLTQGRREEKTVYAANPVDLVRSWTEDGATWIHVVDLSGAFGGAPTQLETVLRIASACQAQIQMGGGLRTLDAIQQAFDAGVDRAVIGSVATTNPALANRMIDRYGDRLALAVDVRNGRFQTHGWTASGDASAARVAATWAQRGVKTFIVTDVQRDGTLRGPNLSLLRDVAAAVGSPVIASGGVSTCEDLTRLRQSPASGAIVGKALYEGRFSLREAIAAARGS